MGAGHPGPERDLMDKGVARFQPPHQAVAEAAHAGDSWKNLGGVWPTVRKAAQLLHLAWLAGECYAALWGTLCRSHGNLRAFDLKLSS